MTAIASVVIVVLAVAAAATAQRLSLTGCDDCCTVKTALNYGPYYFNGGQVGAFSVCSNGHVLLLPSISSDLRLYSYNPQPISQTDASYMLAPFWSDVNLACPGTTNTVYYQETCESAILTSARYLSGDSSFNPTSALVVEYEAVQAYTCPASCATNTYDVIFATDPASCKSYVIFQYQNMQWSKATPYYNDPTVGYSNGQCQGRQQSLYGDPASYVQQCQYFVYRVDRSGDFSQQVQAQNKGTIALQQQQKDEGAAKVVMQEFAEKNGDPGKADMQKQLNMALQNAQKENRVVMQNFSK